MKNPAYSIVLPIYNEEKNIPILLKEISSVMESIGKPYEIICVDDGSNDGSLKVLMEAKKLYPVVIIQFENNAGQSAATDAGFRNAKGDIIITMDADLQNDPADIPALLSALENHDMAVGWRKRRMDNLVRKVSSFIGNNVRNLIIKDKIKDTGCSLKAIRKPVIEKMKLFKGMHRFLPALAMMDGFTVNQIPVNHRPRSFGKTKYGLFNRLFVTISDLLVVRWMKNRAIHYTIARRE